MRFGGHSFHVARASADERRTALLFGTPQDDVLEGGGRKDVLIGRGGDDRISGGDGGDFLVGGCGRDRLDGGDGLDILLGGDGRDLIEGGRGGDFMIGGRGRDTLLSISWDGEPEIAQETARGVTKVEPHEPLGDDDDVLKGGEGRDRFEFRWLIDAKAEILDKHRDASGDVNYRAVAGENGAPHDHWVESIGRDVVVDFKAGEDKLVFKGHTVALRALTIVDADRDGAADDTLLEFYSEQGGAGAHQGDDLGSVVLLDVELTEADIKIDAGVFYGVEDPFSAGG